MKCWAFLSKSFVYTWSQILITYLKNLLSMIKLSLNLLINFTILWWCNETLQLKKKKKLVNEEKENN